MEVNGIAYDVVYESKNVAASTPVTRKTSAPAAPQVQVSAPQAAATSASSIKAPLPGTISAINVKVGDQVKAFIKEISGTRIALSLKFEDANPWKNASDKYAVGNEVTGRVARMTDFGAFVELEPGVDALLHVSQISKEHIEKPADVLSVGQEVTAKVVDFNEADKKISLSIKALNNFEPAGNDNADEAVSVDIEAAGAGE